MVSAENGTAHDVVGQRRRYAIVVIAASAGGLTALKAVLGSLPADFPLPIVIVQHIAPHHISRVAAILGRHTPLPVRDAAQQDVLRPATVYVAPPDFHAEFLGRTIMLTHTPPVHFARPSADRSFLSAAEQGPVIGVVLSGAGTDGSAGVVAIKAAGGVVIAQDQATASYFSMPQSAIETGAVEYVLPLEHIGPTLIALAETSDE